MSLTLILGMVLAVVGNIILGTFWYSSAAFGKRWMELVGITMNPNDPQMQNDMKRAMIVSPLLGLVIAAVMVCFMKRMGIDSMMAGALFGFTAWLGFIATTCYNDVIYSRKPVELYLINVGYLLCSFVLMGAILAKFI